jgi:hypothetical protein
VSERQPILEEMVESRPRLLRARVLPGRGRHAAEILLTFERSHLEVSAGTSGLRLQTNLEPEARPDDWVDVAEEDPWWTVMGAPLTEMWAARDEAGALQSLDLQLREAEDNPKVICLTQLRDGVRVLALTREAWAKRVGEG